MKVFQIHSFYQESGGERQVLIAEQKLLEENGIRVTQFTKENKSLTQESKFNQAVKTIWNCATYSETLSNLEFDSSSQVAHVHNTFPGISPSVYYAAKANGVPVVQTLHNYRLLCPNGLFFRNGMVCQKCLDKKFKWPGVIHKCYRNSYAASLITVFMLLLHHYFGTYRKKVDIYIALTEFAKRKFIQGGLPKEKVFIKSNFLGYDPGIGAKRRNYALFVGRLSGEKGLFTLLSAWKQLLNIPLIVVGDGPLMNEIIAYKRKWQLDQIKLVGYKNHETVLQLIKEASFIIHPSICYENCPMTIIEAFACGTPVIASRLGGMIELVKDGKTGYLISRGDSDDLAAKVKYLWLNSEERKEMGRQARIEYEKKYTAEINFANMMKIYHSATVNYDHEKFQSS